MLQQKIAANDTAFFAAEADVNHRLYFVRVILDFDSQVAKHFALDLCSFPTREVPRLDDLTNYQRTTYAGGRKPPDTARLISTCQRVEVSDFVENIFLLASCFGAAVVSTKKIITCAAFNFMAGYIDKLCIARA